MEKNQQGELVPKQKYSLIESTNWYSYTSNNPSTYIDVLGFEQFFFSESSTFSSSVPLSKDPAAIGGFLVTITTNVIVDTDKNAITVFSFATKGVFESYNTDAITNVEFKTGELVLDKKTLDVQDENPSVLKSDKTTLGDTLFELPDELLVLDDLSISTETTFCIDSSEGSWFPGSETIEIELEYENDK
jgi:hypothetical protein